MIETAARLFHMRQRRGVGRGNRTLCGAAVTDSDMLFGGQGMHRWKSHLGVTYEPCPACIALWRNGTGR